jgi:hypothetical protein
LPSSELRALLSALGLLVRGFRNERCFIPLGRMVIVSICLCWNVLLEFLLRWHRELLFGWNTVGANVGGLPEKFG